MQNNSHTSNLAWAQLPCIKIASIYCLWFPFILQSLWVGSARGMQVDKNGKSEACRGRMGMVLLSGACTHSLLFATVEVNCDSLANHNPELLSITSHNWAIELPITAMQSPWQYFPICQSNTMLMFRIYAFRHITPQEHRRHVQPAPCPFFPA